MVDEINNLYQELILDHSMNPHNFKKIDHATNHAKGNNPFCGDKLEVFLVVESNIIKEISFYGDGCAISKASASIMTQMLKGKTIKNSLDIYKKFHNLVANDNDLNNENINSIDDSLGKLSVFAGVKKFPLRVKCATLAWHAVKAALEQKDITITTES